MVKDVFLIDVEVNSRQNGIGTYLRTLVPIIKESGCNVEMISLNSGVESFEVGERLNCKDYKFPTCDYNAHAEEFCNVLSSYIEDSDTMVFWIN